MRARHVHCPKSTKMSKRSKKENKIKDLDSSHKASLSSPANHFSLLWSSFLPAISWLVYPLLSILLGVVRWWKTTNRRKSEITASPLYELDGNDSDNGTQHICIVALDCEMVGVGYKGRDNMLARCSVVMLNQEGVDTGHESTDFKLLYDKVVKPTRRVVDYRTEFSGITREMLSGDGHLPLVDFQVCRSEVRQLLSSHNGENVLVVGHGKSL